MAVPTTSGYQADYQMPPLATKHIQPSPSSVPLHPTTTKQPLIKHKSGEKTPLDLLLSLNF